MTMWVANVMRRLALAGKPYTAARLREILNSRDDFIVSKGLWPEYVASLNPAPPQPAPTAEGGKLLQPNDGERYDVETPAERWSACASRDRWKNDALMLRDNLRADTARISKLEAELTAARSDAAAGWAKMDDRRIALMAEEKALADIRETRDFAVTKLGHALSFAIGDADWRQRIDAVRARLLTDPSPSGETDTKGDG